MASMTSADVTYVQQEARMSGPGRVTRRILLTFPNNGTNNQYVVGGIPLDKGKLGCPRNVSSLQVLGRTASAGETNPLYEWNGSTIAPTLIGLETGAAVNDRFHETDTGTFVTDSQVVVVDVEGY